MTGTMMMGGRAGVPEGDPGGSGQVTVTSMRRLRVGQGDDEAWTGARMSAAWGRLGR